MIERRREAGGTDVRSGARFPFPRFRSILKAVSWRITGSIDTFVLSLIFTGSVKVAGSIAGAEAITKMILYTIFTKEPGPSFAGISKDKLVAGALIPLFRPPITRLARRSTGLLESFVQIDTRILMPDHLGTTVWSALQKPSSFDCTGCGHVERLRVCAQISPRSATCLTIRGDPQLCRDQAIRHTPLRQLSLAQCFPASWPNRLFRRTCPGPMHKSPSSFRPSSLRHQRLVGTSQRRWVRELRRQPSRHYSSRASRRFHPSPIRPS